MNKIIIIGAPRSGTNMLRDILASLDGICTWPCDEINYIWRHGNVGYPSDEIPATKATISIKKFINSCFDDIRDQYKSDIVVEKTCANSLRVPFVDKILPDAKYIFIYRDGIDATGSAKERWTADLDIPYLLKKVKFVPKIDLPYYAMRYFWSRFYRLISKEKHLAFWGPTLKNQQLILQNHSLNEVCALQWQQCVDKAEDALSKMPNERVIRVRYEDFTSQPKEELRRILKFVGKNVTAETITMAVKDVSSQSLGKGRRALGDAEVLKLEKLVGETLKRYAYV